MYRTIFNETIYERDDATVIINITSAGTNAATAAQIPNVSSIKTVVIVTGTAGVILPSNTQPGDEFSLVGLGGFSNPFTLYLQSGETFIVTGASSSQLFADNTLKVSINQWS